MLSKINVLPIVRDHIGTLQNNRTKKTSIADILLFFGSPVVLAAVLLWFDKLIVSDARNILAATMAVFVGLLFNVLLLLHEATRREVLSNQDRERQKFFTEVYFNLAFSIFVAIGTLVALLATVFVKGCAVFWLSGVVYYLAGVFALTLLMVLKRLHIIFSGQFK
jgi:hypothetical protein